MEFVAVGVVAVVALIMAVRIGSRLPVTLANWADAVHRAGDDRKAEFLYSLALKVARRTDSAAPTLLPRALTPLPYVLRHYSVFLFQLAKYDKSFALDEERLALLEAANDIAHAAAAASALAVSA